MTAIETRNQVQTAGELLPGSVKLRSMPMAVAGWLLASVAGLAADRTPAIDFNRDVLPVMREHCIDCHGPDTQEAHLRLDSAINALRGGDSGEPTIIPGKSDGSYLLTRVLHQDPKQRMPPDSPALDAQTVTLLKRWIDDAEAWQPAAAALEGESSQHWAFQEIVRPEPRAGERSPIDAFIVDQLSQRELVLSPPADRRTLIRRLYLVMHGLPPDPEEVERFVRDERPDAWALLVDRVLASPRYGERWATHWLDVVRFGETHGFETNRERPNAWLYRDWVIESFNTDKPFDRFVVEQLAGDVVGADIGTGFLVAGPYDQVKGQDPMLRLMQRQDELADMINTTGTAFLGLTLGCARCHNHKFDPVTQKDYYALQAVFAGVNHADRALPQPAETQAHITTLDVQIAELRRELDEYLVDPQKPASGRRPAVTARENLERFAPTPARFVRFTILKTNRSQPCLDELEIFAGNRNVALAGNGGKASSSGDFVHPLHKLEHIHDGRYGNSRSWIASEVSGGWVQIELPEVTTIDRIVWARDREGRYTDRIATDYRIAASLDGQTWQILASSADRMPFTADPPREPEYDFSGRPAADAERGRQLLSRLKELSAEREAAARPRMVYGGTFSQPGPTHRLYRGEPNAPREVVVPGAIRSLSDVQLDANAPERDRRLAIAGWIADPSNPLTPRVIVNRLWQFHFGSGLVDTPNDFGSNGSPPSHPALLDWLASELMEAGWSLKHMHRLILNTRTWQQDSRPHEAGLATDAAARLLWRFPPRRLEAEAIRDSMLQVSGALNHRMGGPGFSAFEVEAENVRHYHPKTEFGPEDWRRMIYMTKVRQERDAVFGVFDCPDCSQVVPKRSRSTTPLQALNLLNSHFVMQQAESLADRLEREESSPQARITRAYDLCFGRLPTADEVALALQFVEQSDWHQFARAMLNANEFVFIP